MIEVEYYDRYKSIENRISKFPGIYTIESECQKGAVYGFHDDEFVFINPVYSATCKLHEIPQFVNKMEPGLSKELTDICEMVDELRDIYERMI